MYDTVNLAVIDPPVAVLRDTVLCDEWSYVLQVYADSANYLWSTGDTLPGIVPKSSNTYWVEITNPCGQIRDEAEIEVRRCMCNVWIPSAFTPNGDGVNDRFLPLEDYPGQGLLTVHNRWGQKVFTTASVTSGWSGADAPDGTYFWTLEALEDQGNPRRSGYVTLLRGR